MGKVNNMKYMLDTKQVVTTSGTRDPMDDSVDNINIRDK